MRHERLTARWATATVVVGVLLLPYTCLIAYDAQREAAERDASVLLVNHSAHDQDLYVSRVCSAVLVSPTTILTVDHCHQTPLPDAVVGVHDLCTDSPRYVERIPLVSLTRQGTSQVLKGTLARPVFPATPSARPLTIAAPPQASLRAYGWGDLSHLGTPTCRLKGVSLTTVGLGECDLEMQELSHTGAGDDDYLCAVPTGGTNTCQGDSGGPVFSRSTGRLLGLTLMGRDCRPTSPGLYVRVGDVDGATG